MSQASFYQWRSKYGGMDASMMKEIKQLKTENARLKRLYSEARLKAEIARRPSKKSAKALSLQRDGDASY